MKPILFNTDMVRAILANRKTMTRRPVKPQPICCGPNRTFEPHTKDFFLSAEKNWLRCRVCGNDPEYSREGSNVAHHWIPPYRPGDILYVRETWQNGFGGTYLYKADAGHDLFMTPDGELVSDIPWRPSIHMPREAARIFLKVTEVEVQQVKDITDEEAASEGFASKSEFISVFLKIYPDCTEDSWCWVIRFERIEKPPQLQGRHGLSFLTEIFFNHFFQQIRNRPALPYRFDFYLF